MIFELSFKFFFNKNIVLTNLDYYKLKKISSFNIYSSKWQILNIQSNFHKLIFNWISLTVEMEHILDIYVTNLPPNMRGFIFGFVHVGIMLIGYYTGLSINRFVKIVSKGYIAGIFGAFFHIF